MIVIHLRDLPPNVTPEAAAALVFGAERAARDLIVTIRTEDTQPQCLHPAAPAEPQTGAVRAKPAEMQSAVAREAAAAAASIGSAAIERTLAGIAAVEVPSEVVELANAAGYEIVVSHRGVEAHRSGVRMFVTTGMKQMAAALNVLGSAEMMR